MNPQLADVLFRHALKGGLVGLFVFFVFNIFYLKTFFKAIAEQKAIGLGVLQHMVTHNALYWMLFLLLIVAGSLFGYMLPVSVTPDGIPLKG